MSSPNDTKDRSRRSSSHQAPPVKSGAEVGGIAEAFETAAAPPEAPALPWMKPPTDLGSALCSWCGRDIHAPVLPCSVAPIDGLAEMITSPGMGERCQWELRTRGITDDQSAAVRLS